MNSLKLLNRLRRKRFRRLGITDKGCVVIQSASNLAGHLPNVGLVLLGVATIGLALGFSREPLANLLVGNAWFSLVLVQSIRSNWENRLVMYVDPAFAFRCGLPIADERLFQIRYWMILYQHSGLAIILGASWLWAASYAEPEIWRWYIAISTAFVQTVLVTGLGCWAAVSRWVSTRRLRFVSLLCLLISIGIVFFGSSMKLWGAGLLLLLLPNAWPGFSLLWLQMDMSWFWTIAWLTVCLIVGGRLCVTSYRRLADEIVVREFVFEDGRPCWMVTELAYDLWRGEIDQTLIHSASYQPDLDETTEVKSSQRLTHDDVADSLKRHRLQESYWDHVGCFSAVVRLCLTQREQMLASMARRPERSWPQQWLWDASVCVLAAMIASMFASQDIASVALSVIALACLYHVRYWPFLAEELLKLPTSISEILWLQTKILWIRLVAWTPLILLSALVIARLASYPTDSALAVMGKLLFTAVLLLPAAQLIHFLSIGRHPWLRWSVGFSGVAFAGLLVVTVLGTFLLLTAQMPLLFSGALLQCAGIAGFVSVGCRWFDRGYFDLR